VEAEELTQAEEEFSPDPTVNEVIQLLKSQKDELSFQLDIARLSNQKLRLRVEELESREGEEE
jgi:hypothetical protein